MSISIVTYIYIYIANNKNYEMIMLWYNPEMTRLNSDYFSTYDGQPSYQVRVNIFLYNREQ